MFFVWLEQFVETHYKKILLFLVILFLGVATWHVSASPATWFDEGINLGIAKSWLVNGVYRLPLAPYTFVTDRSFLITTNYPVLLPVALSLKLFGFSLFSARLPMILFLFLFVCAMYVLARRLYGKNAALVTMALVISFAPFYGDGKAVLGEVPGLVYFLFGLFLLPKELDSRRLFLSGLLFGLSAATKPFFLILAPAIFVGEWFAYSIKTKMFWQRIGSLSLGAILPVLIWLKTILPSFSWNGILTATKYYSNSYAGTDFFVLMAHNVWRFFSESTPLHFLFLLIIFLGGLWQAKKQGKKIHKIEIIILTFCLINLAWYLKTPGWYRYFFTAHILLFLFTPAFLIRLIPRRVAIALLVGLFIFQSIHLFTRRNDSLYNDDTATVFSRQVMTFTKPSDKILIINSPSAAFLLNDREIYQYLQINPKLHFGDADFFNQYQYIILSGSTADLDIPDVDTDIFSRYTPLYGSGHYMLYKRRL